VETKESRPKRATAMKMIVFWTNFLLIVFLERRILGAPAGNIAFAIQGLLTLFCALLITGAIFRFRTWKGMKIIVPILWVVCCLIIMM
jgi:hypothetical protein